MTGASNGVRLARTESPPSPDQGLWEAIRNQNNFIGFENYRKFINSVFDVKGIPSVAYLNNFGVEAYNTLRLATEVYLFLSAGVVNVRVDQQGGLADPPYVLKDNPSFKPDEAAARMDRPAVTVEEIEAKLKEYFGTDPRLPYIAQVVHSLPGGEDDPYQLQLSTAFSTHFPRMLELLWSYWHEEGMLTQTLNAISMRFQNRQVGHHDPLRTFDLDPLRPLGHFLWGHAQNDRKRMSLPRKAYEYDHAYGLPLYGKAVPQVVGADSRSKFLAAFHGLLNLVSKFYEADADTTVIADAFPLLNSLKEVHFVLAEGAHNQFGDLPWTARVEMLIEQWLLARPEMHEFLRGRYMTPYHEPWMNTVDAMRKLQGWGDVSVTHFNELAVFGEQLLLSVRYGDWSNLHIGEERAKNWARYWRREVQGYIHAYRTVTGVDLTQCPVDATPPGVYLVRQEQERRARA